MTEPMQIGVCGWCIDRNDMGRAIEIASRELDVRIIQIGFFSEEALRSANPKGIRKALHDSDVSLVGSFIGFEGEDYSSIQSIDRTGGFMLDEAYPARLQRTKRAAALTAELEAPLLAIHAGTIPNQSASPNYRKLVDHVREAADAAGSYDVRLLLETGRESVETLLGFVAAVNRPNLGISFDPGNLVIYGMDDPVSAATKLRGRIEIAHLKDAARSARPGVEFGKASPMGTGDVQVPRVLSKLRTGGYGGPLLVEVRSTDAPYNDLRGALTFVRSMT